MKTLMVRTFIIVGILFFGLGVIGCRAEAGAGMGCHNHGGVGVGAAVGVGAPTDH